MRSSGGQPPFSQSEIDAFESASQYLAEIDAAEREYIAGLPTEVVGCCPFCGDPLIRTFDKFGLDGIWWRSDARPAEPPSCPHFCVLLGGVAFDGRPPRGADFEVHCGPEVPYLIPRLMGQSGMLAVVSSVTMQPGYIAWPIAYFSTNVPLARDLTAGWTRTVHTYAGTGTDEWRIDNDEWDFDLRPWLRDGKLRWCAPGSGNTSLSTDSPENCPFVNLPGERQRLVVCGNQLLQRGLPDGHTVYGCNWR